MTVSSQGGGTAEKRGFRYESRWTIQRAAIPVMIGTASTLVIEAPGLRGDGVEFRTVMSSGTEVCQAKREFANGTWTVNRLISENVLGPLGRHLADANVSAVFVSGTQAQQLQSLHRRAADLDLFSWLEDLPSDLRKDLESIKQAWDVDDAEAHERLGRLEVITVSEEYLAGTVSMLIGGLVDGDQESATELLAGYLADNLHRELDARELWGVLENHGYLPVDVSRRMALSQQMRVLVERFRVSVEDGIPRGLPVIVRSHVAAVVDALSSVDGPRVVALVGPAGAGKSTVLAQAIEELENRGVVVGPIRLDQISPAATASELGQQEAAGFNGSPAMVLNRASSSTPAVLMIDQLDSLSAASGRENLNLEGVRETLRQARASGHVRVLIACRAHDLRHDRRLRLLLANGESKMGQSEPPLEIEVGDLEPQEVSSSLIALGFDPAQLHPHLAGLLRSAFNLSLFAHLVTESRETGNELNLGTLGTRIDLLREADLSFGRRFQSITHTDSYSVLTNEIARSMSESGVLSLPSITVLPDRAAARNALLSEGVLVEEANRIRFLHESFFEYVYAKQHVSHGSTASDLVRDDLQDLLRRGQVRSILVLERDANPAVYKADLANLLNRTGSTRSHLRAAIINWLGDLETPSDFEIEILRAIEDDRADPLRYQAIQSLARPSFARRIAAAGDLNQMAAQLAVSLAETATAQSTFTEQENDQMWTLQRMVTSVPEDAAAAALRIVEEPEAMLIATGALLRLVHVAGQGAGENVAALFTAHARELMKMLEEEVAAEASDGA